MCKVPAESKTKNEATVAGGLNFCESLPLLDCLPLVCDYVFFVSQFDVDFRCERE